MQIQIWIMQIQGAASAVRTSRRRDGTSARRAASRAKGVWRPLLLAWMCAAGMVARAAGTMTTSFELVDISPPIINTMKKFSDAVLVGDGRVVFCPLNANAVVVFDPTDDTFTSVDISAHINTDMKFWGGALAGDGRVVFAPYSADGVGVFDPTASPESSFTMVPLPSDPLINVNGKFWGAATLGDGRVVFAPHSANAVVVFDPTDDTFTLVDISAKIDMIYKFMGAVVVGDGRVVFAPFNANGVGVFNATAPPESSFTLVPFVSGDPLIGTTGKFSGAATAQDGRVVFVPYGANGAGVFDPVDDSFVFVDLSDTKTAAVNFAGATTLGDGRVVFAPLYADSVGVFYPPPGKWCDCCEAKMAKLGLNLGRECVITPP